MAASVTSRSGPGRTLSRQTSPTGEGPSAACEVGELLQTAHRQDEVTEHPGVLARAVERVLVDRAGACRAQPGEKSGVVDQ